MSTKYIVAAALVGGLVGVGCVAELELGDEATVEQEVLGPPNNVIVTPTSVDRVTVSWDAVTGAVKYYVYQSTNPGGPFSFINTARAPATSLRVANLSPGTNYCFAVATEDGTGPGGTNSSCGTTLVAPLPPSSVLATTTAGNPAAVRVQWSAVTSATKYYIFQQTGGAGAFDYVSTTLAPSLEETRSLLVPGTKYCYRIQAEAPQGVSAQSATACNTDLQPPAAVTATRVNATRIRVDWSTNTGALKYYVYRSDAGGAFNFITTVLASSPATFTNINLTTGTQYCYRMQTQYSPDIVANRSVLSLPPACATP